jgi:two-component system CheB/CheR fusion protein
MSIANQTFSGEANREGREKFSARLKALGAAYNLLTESSWRDTDIRLIVEGAIAPYQTGGERFAIDGPEFAVTPSRALTMALAINELATNATKYGALSVLDGRVDVRWNKVKHLGVQIFRFEWRESNGPEVIAPTRTGFGSRLIRTMLAKEFCGEVDLRYELSGLVCRLEAPF